MESLGEMKGRRNELSGKITDHITKLLALYVYLIHYMDMLTPLPTALYHDQFVVDYSKGVSVKSKSGGLLGFLDACLGHLTIIGLDRRGIGGTVVIPAKNLGSFIYQIYFHKSHPRSSTNGSIPATPHTYKTTTHRP